MVNVRAILAREVRGAFEQPVAWVALGVFFALIAASTLWFDDMLRSGAASMRRPFGWMAAALIVLVPALTMRLLAEERRSGTLSILSTLPVTPLQIVLGKWLAATALVGVALLGTGSWPLALAMAGPLDPGPVATGYLGLLLVGASFAAIGTATSAVTDSQAVAFLLALCGCLVPWAVGSLLPLFPTGWAPWIEPLTLHHHFAGLARGVLDSRSVVFLGAVVVVALRVAVHALELRRLS